MVLKNGTKMSKSKGNTVSPEDIINQYGADTARLFILFAAPPEKELEWSDAGVEGSYRFLNRVYRLVYELADEIRDASDCYEILTDDDKELAYVLNNTLQKVTEDMGIRFNFNTALSSIMILVNELYRYKTLENINKGLLKYAVNCMILILSPFSPHICEEMWQHMGHSNSLYKEKWPEADESAMVKDEIEIVIQINGKVKEKIQVENNLSKNEFLESALKNDKVKALIEGKNIIKMIPVPGKLINIVIK
jgi:leucyl-tRNA synthetase